MHFVRSALPLTCLFLVLEACAAHGAHCEHPRRGPEDGISVVGHGKALGQPDVARVNVGVEVRAATAEQATAELNQRMAALVESVKQGGVRSQDIRTSNFSINFEQVPEGPPQPMPVPAPAQRPSGKPTSPPAEPPVKLPSGYYRASNTVEVTIRDLNRAAQVLTAATKSGANQVFGIEFQLENPGPLEAQAGAKAVEDAHARALKLAERAGLKLGKVRSVSDVAPGMPMQKGYAAARSDMANMSAVAVERGERTVEATVQVVYEIARD